VWKNKGGIMIIGNNVVLIVTFIFAIAFPAALLIWWKKHTGESIWSFAAGAICFVLFAMVLENLLHQVCLGQNNAISAKILASPVLYSVCSTKPPKTTNSCEHPRREVTLLRIR